MSAFHPVGDLARWRTIYGLLVQVDVGNLLSYEEMAEALELDPLKDRTTIQLAMRRAARELEVVNKRAVDVVTNEGYRVIEPGEHIMLARRHQKKAGKSLARGHSKATNVDLNGLDPETRKALEIVASAFAAQRDFNRRMDVRQEHLERAVAAVTQQTDKHAERTESELTELRERLARLEAQRSGAA